jgi:predicted RNA binding protein YcfA (HicA-like mRNA interferase family)
MPPRMRPVSAEKTISALERSGFSRVRQQGSHVVLRKWLQGRKVSCIVPIHKELAIGTLRSILRQAEITPEEFMDNL